MGLEARLHVLGATAIEALLVVDDGRRYIRVNEAATRLLGAPADQIIGHRIDDYTPCEYWDELHRNWFRFREAGQLSGAYEVLQGNGARQSTMFRADWHYAPGEHLVAAIEVPFGSAAAGTDATLTEREREILLYVAGGLSNQQIGEQLVISPATVKTHLQNIYTKLKVGDRAGAVAWAMRRHLIS